VRLLETVQGIRSITFVLLRREGKVHNNFGLHVSFTLLSYKYEVPYCPVIDCVGLSSNFLL